MIPTARAVHIDRSPTYYQLITGSRVVRIDPLQFLAGYHKRRLNQALSVLYLRIVLCVYIVVYYGHFCVNISFSLYVFLCIVSFRCCAFCLLVVAG